MILLVDVYHEFSHPEQMLAAIRRSLKPNGRVALVEFRAEDPDVPIKPLHKMSKSQIMKEFPPNGFKLVGEFDKLPWQHVMFFERDDAVGPPSRGGHCSIANLDFKHGAARLAAPTTGILYGSHATFRDDVP